MLVFSYRDSFVELFVFNWTQSVITVIAVVGHNMSRVKRNPVFGVPGYGRHKPDCTTTEDGKKYGILDLGSGVIVLSMQLQTKALVSCDVGAQLICTLVCAYAKIMLSHDPAQIKVRNIKHKVFCLSPKQHL